MTLTFIYAKNILPVGIFVILFLKTAHSEILGKKMNFEMCTNSLPRPGPTQGPEYDCLPRDVLVKLDLPLGYSHVAPDHVTVKRCGGSCHFDR